MPPENTQSNANFHPVSVNEKKCAWYQPLCQVTPLSKYLASAIFIALPFIGGYIGYRITATKVIEVPVLISVPSKDEVMHSENPVWMTPEFVTLGNISTSSERYTVIAYIRELHLMGKVVIDPIEDFKFNEDGGSEPLNTSTSTFEFAADTNLQSRSFRMDETQIDVASLQKMAIPNYSDLMPYYVSMNNEGKVVEIIERFEP